MPSTAEMQSSGSAKRSPAVALNRSHSSRWVTQVVELPQFCRDGGIISGSDDSSVDVPSSPESHD